MAARSAQIPKPKIENELKTIQNFGQKIPAIKRLGLFLKKMPSLALPILEHAWMSLPLATHIDSLLFPSLLFLFSWFFQLFGMFSWAQGAK